MNDSFTVKSMADALVEDRNKNGYKSKAYNYKEQTDEHKSNQVSLSIDSKKQSLQQAMNAPKVDLSNTQQVQERTYMYLEACSMSACFPSVMGLSGALGCSRQNLNRWLLSHPEHATTEFINMTKDVMADILTNASFYNNANAVAVIFQLKNHFGHSDRVEIAPVTPNQLSDDEYNAEDIRRRYLIDTADETDD